MIFLSVDFEPDDLTGGAALPDNGWPADRIDTENAHSARIYDYILGGKDYYPADKEAGDAMARSGPPCRST